MTKKNHRHKNNNSSPGLKFIVGTGLVLIGLAAFFMLLGTKNTQAPKSVSSSVIPMVVNYPAPKLSVGKIETSMC